MIQDEYNGLWIQVGGGEKKVINTETIFGLHSTP